MKGKAVAFAFAISLLIPLCVESSDGAKTYLINKFETGYMKGLPTSGYYNGIAIGDVDGDSYLDMAFGGCDYSGSTVGMYVYRGFGNGTWTKTTSGLPSTDSWGGVAIGDADADGKMELYAGDEGWGSDSGSPDGVGAWEYSSGSWSSSGISSPQTTSTVNDVKLLNITKGPGLDLAFTFSNSGGGIRVYYGSGSSSITWTSFSTGLPTSGEYTGVSIGDLNSDGLPDLAAGSYSNAGVKVCTQSSTGWTDISSSLPSSYTSGNFDSVEIGDIDKDGKGDLVFSSSGGGVKLLLGNAGGSGGTSFSWTDVTSNLPASLKSGRMFQLKLADIDLDTDLDLLAPQYSGGLKLFLGNGSVAQGTSFRITEVTGKGLPTSNSYVGAALFDFDKDGDLDIAGSTWGNGVTFYRSDFTLINGPPVPKITGGDKSVSLGTTVQLSGNTSTDPEDAPAGDPTGTKLTYFWNLTSKPSGSNLDDTAFKPNDASSKPTFTPDKEGAYAISLAVKDMDNKWSNKGSEAKIVLTATNKAPVPQIKAAMMVALGQNISLEGNLSTDLEDAPSGDKAGTILTYDWNLTAKPKGSSLNGTPFRPSDSSAFPRFRPDVEGRYNITLSVKDKMGKWSNKGVEAKLSVVASNLPPIPDAGMDLHVMMNDLATLNGSKSSDPDGHSFTYEWNLTTYPNGSLVREGNLTPSDTSRTTSFKPDVPGRFVFSLALKDEFGKWSNGTDMVTVHSIKPNDLPVADAGMNMAGYVNDTIVLNGSGSYDPDGSIAMYMWNCTDFIVNLTDGNATDPSFVPDKAGVYHFTLKVKDVNETWSLPDEVAISIVERGVNLPPLANAGSDGEYMLGANVTLNGSGSLDLDGSIVRWEWNCSSHPLLALNDTNSSVPWFVPDLAGTYVFVLRVFDDNGTWSEPDEVIVTVFVPHVNDLPIARAGEDIVVNRSLPIYLNGSGSYDPDGAIDAFNWTCIAGNVSLIDAGTSRAYFTPTSPGNYSFQLIVVDNEGAWSLPDLVNVTYVFVPDPPPPPPVDPNVTAVIGPVLFADGLPVPGATIGLHSEKGDHEAETNSTGFATFPKLLPGEYAMDVSFEGEGKFSIMIDIDPKGNVSYPEGGIPTIKKKPIDPVKVKPSIGAIEYEDGTPVEGATVTLSSSLGTHFAATDGSGIAHFSMGVLPGNYTMTVTVDEEIVISLEGVWIKTDGSVVYPGGGIPKIEIEDPVPVKVKPTLGPFLYEDGTAVSGATVTLTGPEGSYQAIVDAAGNVYFDQGIPPGDYNMTVTKDGVSVLKVVDVRIGDDGSVSYPGGTIPRIKQAEILDPADDGKDGSGLNPLYFVIIPAVIVAILGVVVALYLSGRNKEPEEIETVEKTACPDCGSEMVLKQEFGTYFCERCGGSEE